MLLHVHKNGVASESSFSGRRPASRTDAALLRDGDYDGEHDDNDDDDEDADDVADDDANRVRTIWTEGVTPSSFSLTACSSIFLPERNDFLFVRCQLLSLLTAASWSHVVHISQSV